MLFKILKDKILINKKKYFEFKTTNTRGHSMALCEQKYKKDIRNTSITLLKELSTFGIMTETLQTQNQAWKHRFDQISTGWGTWRSELTEFRIPSLGLAILLVNLLSQF